MIDRKQGIRLPLIPPEEAERPYSSAEVATAEKLRRKAIVGSSEQVACVDNAADQMEKRLSSPTCPVLASIDSWNSRCAQDITAFTEPALSATNWTIEEGGN